MGKFSGRYEIKKIDWHARGIALRELDKIRYPYVKTFPVVRHRGMTLEEDIKYARGLAKEFQEYLEPVISWIATVGCSSIPDEYIISIDDRAPPELVYEKLVQWGGVPKKKKKSSRQRAFDLKG